MDPSWVFLEETQERRDFTSLSFPSELERERKHASRERRSGFLSRGTRRGREQQTLSRKCVHLLARSLLVASKPSALTTERIA